jgi:hypothetical protein
MILYSITPIFCVLLICGNYYSLTLKNGIQKSNLKLQKLQMGFEDEVEGLPKEIPRPNIISPATGKKNSELEKFLMMYTCKICNGRNAQMVTANLHVFIFDE